MAASAFMVSLPLKGGYTLEDGVDTVLVWAEDAAQAKSMAKAYLAADGGVDAKWDDATATPMVVGTELEGWVFQIKLTDNADPFTLVEVSVTGANGNAIDDIGAALVTALNATAQIANAAYDAPSNVLTIVDTGDSMGDWDIRCYAYPPSAQVGDASQAVSGLFGAVSAAGAAASARTSTLVATLPVFYGAGRLKR